MGVEEMKREGILNLCNQQWVQRCLIHSQSDTCSRKEGAALDSMFGMLGYISCLGQSGCLSEVALNQINKHIDRF